MKEDNLHKLFHRDLTDAELSILNRLFRENPEATYHFLYQITEPQFDSRQWFSSAAGLIQISDTRQTLPMRRPFMAR